MCGVDAGWVEAIADWSSSNPAVLETYLFGSRVKGTHKENSDLDIAVRVGKQGEEPFTTWICDGGEWQAALEKLVPVEVDLRLIQDDDEVVWPSVQDHGQLIFRR